MTVWIWCFPQGKRASRLSGQKCEKKCEKRTFHVYGNPNELPLCVQCTPQCCKCASNAFTFPGNVLGKFQGKKKCKHIKIVRRADCVLCSKVYIYGCNNFSRSTHQLMIAEPRRVRSADRCLIGFCSWPQAGHPSCYQRMLLIVSTGLPVQVSHWNCLWRHPCARYLLLVLG